MSRPQSIIVIIIALTIVPLLITLIAVVVSTNATTIFVSNAAISTNATIVNHTIGIAIKVRVFFLANPITAFRALEPAIVGYTTLPTTTIAAPYFTHQTTFDLSIKTTTTFQFGIVITILTIFKSLIIVLNYVVTFRLTTRCPFPTTVTFTPKSLSLIHI